MQEPATATLVERLASRLHAEVVETHISWVLLAGPLAYKLKKPLRLPFVDYSTPERRHHFCEEEVRLNRRFAPSLYLGVSRVTGPAEAPEFDGPGPVLDHAVRMRRFPAGALFSEQLAAGTLQEEAVDRLAALVADAHAQAPVSPEEPDPDPGRRRRQALAALEGARPLLGADEHAMLRDWLASACRDLAPVWARRRAAGRVRECHGDLHLANVVSLGAQVAAFDCIEFDASLRWIDVLEDAAFPLMDFCARGRSDLGWRFFDGWLARTGDHDGLPALRLCVVARALVRAQVEHMRMPHGAAARACASTAIEWTRSLRPRLAITHGLPASGKTFAARAVQQRQGGICLRSDVERKRMYGLPPLQDSHAQGLDLYTPEAKRQTYQRLFALARTALQAGFPVVLDAAFLRWDERRQALALAREFAVPFAIIDCEAPLPVLRQRLRARRGDASEADEAVLEQLRRTAEPLQRDELPFLVPA